MKLLHLEFPYVIHLNSHVLKFLKCVYLIIMCVCMLTLCQLLQIVLPIQAQIHQYKVCGFPLTGLNYFSCSDVNHQSINTANILFLFLSFHLSAKPLVISHHGASGNFPGCTDVAYEQAIKDGADVIDCTVQMSKDGIPFCTSTVNLMNSTLVGQTQFRSQIATVKDFGPAPGIYSFSLNWADIQGLTRKWY